jgi:hypothetical protein
MQAGVGAAVETCNVCLVVSQEQGQQQQEVHTSLQILDTDMQALGNSFGSFMQRSCAHMRFVVCR